MTDAGTQVATQPTTSPGNYYYRINTKSAEVWKTRLNVTSGEAQLYLRRGQIPVVGQVGVRKSDLPGSDGIVLSSADFAPGENWFILVVATGASNTWSLVTGETYVRDLGSLPFTDSNNDGSYTLGEASQNAGVTLAPMPPEGVVFYKVTLPQNVPAWSLWLNGGNQLIGVRKSKVPVLFASSIVADRRQTGSMLLVPPYLGAGSDTYFVSVIGTPGSQITLDSRIQTVESMAFDGVLPTFSVTESPYKVFRVDVPSGQIVWDVTLNRLSGDPAIAIKKDTVPSETENDAVNEAPGEVNDSISIVAPALTNGIWFVTVYGSADYETGIVSGPPDISDIGYRDEVTNDQPLRSGWRYYRVPDFAAQVGTLGWEVDLANAPAGTEIAIRRAQIPGIWQKRTGGSTNLTEVKYADASSKNGILQRVDHEADIWYVGVYQPSLPLGAFTLTLDDIKSSPAVMDGSLSSVTEQVEGSWKYFRVVVPDDSNLLGWYLNLTGVSGTVTPKITVRRDRLPPSSTLITPTSPTWASGASWSQDLDFTGLMTNTGNVNVSGQQFLAVKGSNRPLVAGTYYVGILAGAAQPSAGEVKTTSYTLQSRGIGTTGFSIPITPLALNGGNLGTNPLAPREFRFFSVTIPPGANLTSWQLDLTPTVGEMLMQVRRDSIPDFFASNTLGDATSAGGKRLKRPGKDSLVLLPNHAAASLDAGTYYIAAISEGLAPTATVMGDGQAAGTLTSTQPATTTHLGLVSPTATLSVPVNLKGGDLATYQITVPAGMKVLEAYLTDRIGNPGLSIIRGPLSPVPFPGTTSGNGGYGWIGGQTAANHPVLVTVQDPTADEYSIIVRANADATGFVDGTATLNFRLIDTLPMIDPVNGSGQLTVTDQIAESWRYFQLNIPEDARLKGIRVTLKNVTSGVPRMVIRKGTQMPKDFTTTSGLHSDSTTWLANQQWFQGNDFTTLQKDSTGAIVAGRYFLAAYGAPMDAGTYIIGVAKDASVNTVTQPNAPTMSYSVVAEAIGDDLDIPINSIDFINTTSPEQIVDLPEREIKFYKVNVPAGRTSWRIHLAESLTTDASPKVRDGGMTIRRNRIPAFDSGTNPNARGGSNVKMIAMGDHWVLLPTTTDALIEAGEYYITVTSFGENPTSSQTGTGSSSLTLFTNGELPVEVFPTLSVESTQTLPYALGPAEIAAYEFTVPARASNETPYGLTLDINRGPGAANYSMRKVEPSGLGLPTPPGSGTDGYFGGLAPFASTTDATSGWVFQQIAPGTYRVIVRSSQEGSGYGNSFGSLSARLLISSNIPTLQFDGENLGVINAGATTDILQYRVEIPDEPNWQAWGIRLDGPVSGRPGIIVRRALPVETTTGLSVTSDMIDWPSGHQWTQTDDFTKLRNDPLTPTGADRDRSQQFFMASREKPLQPGTYFIGIDNRGGTTISPRTFTIRTFAVGDGYSIPINDLSEIGAQASIAIPTPRMPSVHKITIPPLTKAWAVSLTPTIGDLTLRVRYGSIPDPVNDTAYPDAKGGVHVQKSGDERMTLLPKPGNTYLPEGDYYVMAVSEGQNPSLSGIVLGTGEVLGTIKNEGPINITPLGTVTETGLSQPVSLAAAEVRLFSVEVPPGINNLEFRLKDRSGEANLSILRDTQIPAPGISESYGLFGGETAGPPSKDRSIINLGNPTPGIYTIAVRAAGTLPSNYTLASATLSVNVIKPSPLNFAQELNAGNGLSNIDNRTLSDKEKYSYRVAIPRQIAGEEVMGWLVTLEQGNPIVRIYKSESDFGKVAPVTLVGRSALVVPPFLTFDTNWFIEVEGVGTTDYIIKSQPVKLTGTPWTLPSVFNLVGGDSSPGEPDGQGIRRELPQDAWEFHALDVPENNLGLLRLALEQYGGNTNVYVRHNAIPTMDHLSNGTTGTRMFNYKMIAETSEAGNFSELSDTVRQPNKLLPGRWYVAVKSEPLGAVRTGSGYRLKAHSGVVTEVDLTTAAPLTNQNLAERDWRYYRFTIPRTGIPVEWKPFFSRISGSSIAYIRDTLPPFSFVPLSGTSVNNPTFMDWSTDLKNKAPAGAFPRALAPGTNTLTTPPLRPGATYFLGIYGNTAGGSVEVSSSVSAQQIVLNAEMAYDTDSTVVTVPGNSSSLVRITTTPTATRLKIECLQSAVGLSLKLEQGTLPYTAVPTAAHKQNSAPFPVNFTFNETLSTTWPFVANQDYYLLLTNTTAAPITSTITTRGSSTFTEDEDNDGLLDPWEILYFGNLAQTPAGDFDGDGSTNLQELENGTLPKDAASVLYRLNVLSPGGSHTRDPLLPNYPSGTSMQVLATPAPGDTFRQWKSNLSSLNGSTNPTAVFSMFANVDATAVFQTSVSKA
ncbi:MAG: InlB B-repeat-containing protein, partial [Luteolibacter sp.]